MRIFKLKFLYIFIFSTIQCTEILNKLSSKDSSQTPPSSSSGSTHNSTLTLPVRDDDPTSNGLVLEIDEVQSDKSRSHHIIRTVTYGALVAGAVGISLGTYSALKGKYFTLVDNLFSQLFLRLSKENPDVSSNYLIKKYFNNVNFINSSNIQIFVSDINKPISIINSWKLNNSLGYYNPLGRNMNDIFFIPVEFTSNYKSLLNNANDLSEQLKIDSGKNATAVNLAEFIAQIKSHYPQKNITLIGFQDGSYVTSLSSKILEKLKIIKHYEYLKFNLINFSPTSISMLEPSKNSFNFQLNVNLKNGINDHFKMSKEDYLLNNYVTNPYVSFFVSYNSRLNEQQSFIFKSSYKKFMKKIKKTRLFLNNIEKNLNNNNRMDIESLIYNAKNEIDSILLLDPTTKALQSTIDEKLKKFSSTSPTDPKLATEIEENFIELFESYRKAVEKIHEKYDHLIRAELKALPGGANTK